MLRPGEVSVVAELTDEGERVPLSVMRLKEWMLWSASQDVERLLRAVREKNG